MEGIAGGAWEGASFESAPCSAEVGKDVAFRTEGRGPTGAASGEESSCVGGLAMPPRTASI